MSHPTDVSVAGAVRELLSTTLLSREQVDARVDRAWSPEYWKSLNPSLSVGEPPASEFTNATTLGPELRRECIRRFHDEGHLHLGSVVPPGLIGRMRAGVDALVRADWPAVFSWLYDEFWLVPRLTPLVDVFSGILGPAYRQTPYVWTHVVPGRRGSSGWAAHVDNSGPDRRLTVWIPLTDTAHDTGGMFVIPKDLVPAGLAAQWRDRTSFSAGEVKALLQAARPLDCSAGSVLAWDARLIHWGSAPQAEGDPRISFSMEFIGAHGDPLVVARSPAGGPGPLPGHDERLRLVATAITLFASKEPRAVRYVGLADRLLERLGAL